MVPEDAFALTRRMVTRRRSCRALLPWYIDKLSFSIGRELKVAARHRGCAKADCDSFVCKSCRRFEHVARLQAARSGFVSLPMTRDSRATLLVGLHADYPSPTCQVDRMLHTRAGVARPGYHSITATHSHD